MDDTNIKQSEIDKAVLCTWSIPGLKPGAVTELAARTGHISTIVGPNGSGKSSLGHWLAQNAADASIHRVIAHRRVWFESAGSSVSQQQREELKSNVSVWDSNIDSRWRDHAQGQRPGLVLFDLLARINDYNARAVDLFTRGVSNDEVNSRLGSSPLKRINDILSAAHLAITISTTERASFEAKAESNPAPYPISEMSDGEKSALLLAAEIMTAQPRSVVIIDEPERHLHRLISAALIESVVADRPDCHFVVLTHDLDLAATLPRDRTTVGIVTRTAWDESRRPAGWDMHLVTPEDPISESVRLGILGGRHTLLFIEGQRHSIDTRLYQVLFPGWALTPVGSCEQVIRAVVGLNASEQHHWVDGRGIVDQDGRDPDERTALAKKGVLCLKVDEIENLYYVEAVRTAVAERQAQTFDISATSLLAESKIKALSAIREGDAVERLAASTSQKIVSRALVEHIPDKGQFTSGLGRIKVEIPSPYGDELGELHTLLATDNLEEIIIRYPVRDTGLRAAVSTCFKFKSVGDYEAAALARIRDDAHLAATVRRLAGQLPPPVRRK